MSNTIQTKEFRVPVENIALLVKKIADLNKKAKKLGTKECTITYGDRVVVKVNRGNVDWTDDLRDQMWGSDRDLYREYQMVSVEGEMPILPGGWVFVGKLEPHEAGTIVKSIPGQEIPESFQEADAMYCEHCKTRRYRKETFVVKSGSTYVQVGRSCLKDFLGHASPEQYASYAEYLMDMEATIRDIESYGSMGAGDYSTNTVETIAAAISAIKRDGFAGSSSEYTQPTKFTVMDYFVPPRGDAAKGFVQLVVTDDDTKKAELTIEWVKVKAQSNKDEFWQNLNKFVSVQVNKPNTYGYLAAAAMMFLKEQNELAAKQKLSDGIKDEAIGNEGVRVQLTAEVISAHKYQRQSYHYYDSGMSQILMLKTKNGNLVKMFSSNLDIEKGNFVQLTGRLGRCEVETFDKSPFKGKKVTMMAPRARMVIIDNM